MSVRWVAPGNTVLYWESWGEQHAVFDLRSGETHMLPDQTAWVLKYLASCPATVKDVAGSVPLASDQVCDEKLLEHITGLCLQLQKVGLIEKADT
jgi:PqqD family protein of HPr-rel-A system